MKKLISVLSSLVPVLSVASTIVACNNSVGKADETADEKPTDGSESNNGENANPEREKVLTELSREFFEEQLGQTGVDGSLLNNNSSVSDAFALITAKVKEINENVNAEGIKLVGSDDLEKSLQIGNNIFTISFDINGTNEEFQVVLKDVQDANHLNKKELETYIRGILKDEALLAITGSHTNEVATWTTNIAKKINEKAPTATVHITTANDSNLTKKTVTIEVDNLPNGIEKITEVLNYEQHSKPVGENHVFEEIIKSILTGGIDASHLHEYMQWSKAVVALEAEALKIDKKAEIKLSEPNDGAKKLVVGHNQIDIVLKIGERNPISITAKLLDVRKWSNLEMANNIFAGDITLEANHGYNTFDDVIHNYQKVFDTLFKNEIKLHLKNPSEKSKKIQLGLNMIEVTLAGKEGSRNALIKIHDINKNATKVPANPGSFPKISKYLINGIDSTKDLGFYFTTRNTIGQAMYEIRIFLQSLDPEIAVYYNVSTASVWHHNLAKGVNKMKFVIYRGSTISEFSIILKNVFAQ